jgi:NADH:ubiquinone oxidoreductase subunit K
MFYSIELMFYSVEVMFYSVELMFYSVEVMFYSVEGKLTAFSPRKVVHHAVFCKYYAELAKLFFLSDIRSDRKCGSL